MDDPSTFILLALRIWKNRSGFSSESLCLVDRRRDDVVLQYIDHEQKVSTEWQNKYSNVINLYVMTRKLFAYLKTSSR